MLCHHFMSFTHLTYWYSYQRYRIQSTWTPFSTRTIAKLSTTLLYFKNDKNKQEFYTFSKPFRRVVLKWILRWIHFKKVKSDIFVDLILRYWKKNRKNSENLTVFPLTQLTRWFRICILGFLLLVLVTIIYWILCKFLSFISMIWKSLEKMN